MAVASARAEAGRRAFALASLLLAAFGALAFLWPVPAAGQENPPRQQNIAVSLLAEELPGANETVLAALHFWPRSDEWHGYWSNPGDAGRGLEIDWRLPAGWSAGEPLYPVPERLVTAGLMNHVYKGDYAVLVPLSAPPGGLARSPRIAADLSYLACTDTICVPERATVRLEIAPDAPFDEWRARLAPPLDSSASFEVAGDTLRVGVPLPATVTLADPHLFVDPGANGMRPDYAAKQTFRRAGDLLVAELPLRQGSPSSGAERIDGILAFGNGEGVRFVAEPGDAPLAGAPALSFAGRGTALWLLLGGAFLGGLILNAMPCVFPILSLKALSLARAGVSERAAGRDGLAYTAGAVIGCAGLGAAMLALRAGGEEIGWAFQLQEPAVVVALLLLAAVLTANFAGLFEFPTLPVRAGGEPGGAFATGLVAAFVATPCTGPFMAAALGAALLLPAGPALALFAALGLGLAAPFLLIGFVPALRDRLPRPGPWMERFRRWMAVPMGLTALALVWLVSRLGGEGFALLTLVLVAGIVLALGIAGRLQRRGALAWPAFGLVAAPFALFALFALPAAHAEPETAAASLLDPITFSEDALSTARATGAPVFVWFTADWCVTCKVNEQVAIEREATRAAFERAGVISLRGDWTRQDAEITHFLERQGVAGVPLYLWYPPRGDGERLPQVLTPAMLVERADSAAR
jgi:DsbC/DsbD-like thiol-disulfide interchange protein/cytochrome c biogenesis protein CcdA